MKKKKLVKFLVYLVFVLALILIVPSVTTGYSIMIVDVALLYFIAALGLSVMLGIGGQMTFAAVSFMGVGAFTSAQLSKYAHIPTSLSIILGILVAALFAFLIGLVLLRLKGPFFAFSTISLVQIMSNIFLNYEPLTGGARGIQSIPKLNLGVFSPNNLFGWFYLLIAVAIICGLIVERVRQTHLGRALSSVRDNEIAAMSLGVDVFKTKVVAFTIAGALAGLSGALYAHMSQYISQSLFTFNTSLTFIMMVMLGGVNSTVGTFFGALLVTMLPEWLRPLKQYLMIIYGVGIIFLMVYMPMGLAGVARSILTKCQRKKQQKGAEAANGYSK
ncbi:MAG: branched-chain amino acid ABC transporter permease [Synergistaceae bacterium]|jgi:branched-chain amino acid transport system permease protein|nr:branched-chain amino acid ABC transporter permease [Synergistaceae bacterium]